MILFCRLYPYLYVQNHFLDIDECSTNQGGCQHTCYNTDGSYSCKCHTEYHLDVDKHNCTSKSVPDRFHLCVLAFASSVTCDSDVSGPCIINLLLIRMPCRVT